MEPTLPTSSSADSSSSRTSPISLAVAASAQMSNSTSSSEVAATASHEGSTATTSNSTPSNNTTTASLFPGTATTIGTSLTPSMSSLLTHGGADSKPSLLSAGTRSLSSSGSSILPTRSLTGGASGSTSLLSGSTSSLLPTSSLTSGTTTNNNSSTQSSENLPPRTLARVARDVRDLVKKPPEGIRLVLDDETGMPGSLSEIMAEIEGPEQTPYHTRYFQLKLVLSTDFPATPPRGYFLTKIYHPNVDPTTGAICVNTLKKDWTSSTSLSHVLTVIRCLLIVPFPESSLNDEAGKNFMDSYDEYARRAKLLANVHGLTSWSSAKTEWNSNGNGSGSIGEGKTPEGEESPEQDDKKKAATDNGLPNGSSGSGGGLSKKTSRSNIVRAGSKTLDKKSKKKSLRRL